MKRILGRNLLFLSIAALLLVGCGTFEVRIEPVAAPPTETFVPTQAVPAVVTATPAQEVLPTSTVTPRPTAQIVKGRAAAGLTVRIESLSMLDAQNGWCIGTVNSGPDDHIFRTTDGGQTWRDLTPPVLPSNLGENSLVAQGYFVSPMQAWVVFFPRSAAPPVDRVVVWSTINGGQTWDASEPLDLSGMTTEFFMAGTLGFSDRIHGWLLAHLGAGMSKDYIAIFTTEDGGKTWMRVADPDSIGSLMSCQKTGLAFTDAQNAWLVGDCPGLMPGLFVYHSSDGGQNWDQVALPAPAGQSANLFSQVKSGCGFPGIAHSSAEALIFTLRCQMYETVQPLSWLYVSRDGGMTWSAQGLPVPYGSLSFMDARSGWLVGTMKQNDAGAGAELFRTTDSGLNWLSVLSVGWLGEPVFVDSENGWVVAQAGGTSALVTTTNGGTFWRELYPVVGP